MLWGGLALYIAALLPLLFANRGIYTISALLAGIGIGLFIDEVGKYITQSNDYFYPIAASIVYLVFLVTLVVFLHIRRVASTRVRDELAGVFEDICEGLHHSFTPAEQQHLKQRLMKAADSAPSNRHASLAHALIDFLDTDSLQEPLRHERLHATVGRARRVIARLFSDKYLRVYLVVGLVAIGLLNLKNPVTVLGAGWLPENVILFLKHLTAGRDFPPELSPLLASIRVELEVVVGILMLASAALMSSKRQAMGTVLGQLALFLSLTTVDILLFYFEQFSTIITTSIQFLMVIGITVLRRHTARPTKIEKILTG